MGATTTQTYGWWFETTQFRDVVDTEPPVNPGRYGERLSRWLADELRSRSWQVVDTFPEDWGWMICVQDEGRRIYVTCGNEDGSTMRWAVAPDARAGIVARLFGRAPGSAALERLDDELRAILESDPETSWLGREQPAHPAPDVRDA